MEQTRLSVIIVNWNTRDLLAQCLASVFATADNLVLDVWVVDNASSDGSAQMVRECFPQVALIENSENVGFARANNQALQASRGRYVLLLNSDVIVQPGALNQMVTFMDVHAEAGIVGAKVISPDGSPQRCFGQFPTLLSEALYAWGLDKHLPMAWRDGSRHDLVGDAHETDWVLGAALMIRRDALDQVGRLDPHYFMYSEEVDLCYRVKQKGWKNFVVHSARLVHLGGQSSKQMPARMKAELFLSKTYYFRKHHGTLAAGVLDALFSASILAKCLAYRVVNRATSELWAETWRVYRAKK